MTSAPDSTAMRQDLRGAAGCQTSGHGGSRGVVGVLAQVGTGNLGDEATLAALIQNIRQRRPGADILVISPNPDDTRRRHGTPVFPLRPAGSARTGASHASPSPLRSCPVTTKRRLRWVLSALHTLGAARRAWALVTAIYNEVRFLPGALRALRAPDLLLVCGGGQLFDQFGGAWNYPYSLLKWTTLARLTRTPVAFVSVGAGPIHSPLSRLFLRMALGLASYRSYRDEASADLIRRTTGLRNEHRVYPDLAWSLQVDRPAPVVVSAPFGTVGINPFPFRHLYWPHPDLGAYQAYVAKLAAFAAWLIRRGCSVVLLPTQIRADAVVVGDMRATLELDGTLPLATRLHTPTVVSLADLLDQLATLDVLVSSRFHGILLGAALGIPAVAISYHPKIDSLMQQIGQRDYVLDIATFETVELIEAYERLSARRTEVTGTLRRVVDERHEALRRQYHRLLGEPHPLQLCSGDISA